MADHGKQTGDDLLTTIRGLAEEHKDLSIFEGVVNAKSEDLHTTVLCSGKPFSVYRVAHGTKAFVIKQYDGEEASNKIMSSEYKSLEIHHKLDKESSLEPYCTSDKHHCIVMEDFKDWHPLQEELNASRVDQAAIKKLSLVIGEFHKATYGEKHVSEHETAFGSNPQQAKVFHSLFTEPYDLTRVSTLPEDSHLKKIITKLTSNASLLEKVAQFKVKAEKRECLVHGNLTANAVLVKDGQVKIIGNNFASLSVPSLDVGVLVAQYLSQYHTHMLTEQDNDAHRQVSYKMIEAATTTVDNYLEKMGATLGDKVAEFVSDVAGFSGIELIRRAMSAASDSRSAESLDSGIRLLGASHRITTSSQLVNIALMLTF